MAEDFGVNTDWNALLNLAVEQMQHRFGYQQDEAAKLIRRYLEVFTDSKRCSDMGIPVQDEDFFFHEREVGLALRAHYYLALQGDPKPMSFVNWSSEYFKKLHGGQSASPGAK